MVNRRFLGVGGFLAGRIPCIANSEDDNPVLGAVAGAGGALTIISTFAGMASERDVPQFEEYTLTSVDSTSLSEYTRLLQERPVVRYEEIKNIFVAASISAAVGVSRGLTHSSSYFFALIVYIILLCVRGLEPAARPKTVHAAPYLQKCESSNRSFDQANTADYVASHSKRAAYRAALMVVFLVQAVAHVCACLFQCVKTHPVNAVNLVKIIVHVHFYLIVINSWRGCHRRHTA